MLDLRFKSWSGEENFEKKNESDLLYNALTTIVAWHALLLVPAFCNHIVLEHVLLLIPSCMVGAFVFLRVWAGWFCSFNWEFILLLSVCGLMIALPFIADAYLRLVSRADQMYIFFALRAMLNVSVAILIPLRKSISWIFLISDVTAWLAASRMSSGIDMPTNLMIAAILILCWSHGWRLEKSSRSFWQHCREPSSILSSVNPESLPDLTLKNAGKDPSVSKCEVLLNDIESIDFQRNSMHTLDDSRMGCTLHDVQPQTTQGDFRLSEFTHREASTLHDLQLATTQGDFGFSKFTHSEASTLHDLQPEKTQGDSGFSEFPHSEASLHDLQPETTQGDSGFSEFAHGEASLHDLQPKTTQGSLYSEADASQKVVRPFPINCTAFLSDLADWADADGPCYTTERGTCRELIAQFAKVYNRDEWPTELEKREVITRFRLRTTFPQVKVNNR